MSYRTIKDGLANLMKSLGYQESDEAFDFNNVSPRESGITFIIVAEKGELGEGPNGNSESLSDRLYDQQTWAIKLMTQIAEHSDIINRDELLDAKDTVVKEIDDPANWPTYVRVQKYLSWELQKPSENRLVIDIKVKIIDTLVY